MTVLTYRLGAPDPPDWAWPAHLYDAEGKEHFRVVECDTETGRIVKQVVSDEGRLLEWPEGRLLEETVHASAPLRVVKCTRSLDPDNAKCTHDPRYRNEGITPMRPVLDPGYWKERLQRAEKINTLHHAVYVCGETMWRAIEAKHREILARTVGQTDSVLDCGCGWGRLLDLMPEDWLGVYLGVDLSPDFIWKALAETVPRLVKQGKCGGAYGVADLRDLKQLYRWPKFDFAVLVSIRPMIRRECPAGTWETMEGEIRKVAKKLLFLEYDEQDEGSVE